MRKTLIAVAGVALATGGCSLRSPDGPSSYSSLQPEIAALAVEAPAPAAARAVAVRAERHPATQGVIPDAELRSGFDEVPASPRMPGDATQPIPQSSAGGVNPLASLSASARARSQWEDLKPGNFKAHAPVIAIGSGSAGGPSTPAAATIAASAAAAEGYDREAAMQNLINGGKFAGKRICNGC